MRYRPFFILYLQAFGGRNARFKKFGGSSLSNADRFLRAADIIANNAQQEDVAVVLSAPGKTTNKLVAVIDGALKAGQVETQIADSRESFSEVVSRNKKSFQA